MAELRPKLKAGLRFRPITLDRQTEYRIADPSSGRFYDVGPAEYAFLSLLDGDTTVAEALSVAAQRMRDDALSLHEATELIRWAVSSELFEAGPKKESSPSPWALLGAVNPLWMKLPLPSPERVLDVVAPVVGWTQSAAIIGPGLLLSLLAVLIGVGHVGEIRDSFAGILAVSNWLPLAIVWTLLKLWHELGHALACRRYGVEVPRCGLVFILLAPCPYVDATGSWALRSQWQRAHIAAAGMWAEWSVAAVMLIVWPWLDSGTLAAFGLDGTWTRQLAANTLFSATVATLLFNANPLMKFDGYYILSDVTGVANLAQRGATATTSRLSTWFFGERSRTREPVWVETYGWAAACWRVVVTVSLTAAASVLLPGIGLWVGIFGAIASFLPPVVRGVRAVWARLGTGRTGMRPVAVGVVAGTILMTVALARWPFAESLPGVVVWPDDAQVRAGTDGFVETVFVSAGDAVTSGQPLLKLRHEQRQTEDRQLAAEISQSLAKERQLNADGRLSEAQQEDDRRRGLRDRDALLKTRMDRLTVSAPTSGRLRIERPLEEQLGQFVQEGDELAAIETGDIELHVAVSHRLADSVRGREGQSVNVILPTAHRVMGTITRLSPSATREPIDASLCTPSGGPIAVSNHAVSNDDRRDIQTVVPHFPMTVTVTGLDGANALPPGMRVAVELPTDVTVWRHTWTSLTDWWDKLLTQERGR